MKLKFYSVRKLLQLHPDAQYYVIYGERSNGKTYSTLDYCVEDYFNNGHEIAYIRRWKEDIKSKNMNQLFSGLVRDGKIKKYSRGKWDSVVYNNRAFYFAKTNDETGERIVSDTPFCYVYVLTEEEHEKGFESPNIVNIIFDEFIARKMYLQDEFVVFTGILSTIIRTRDNVRIFMLGNTINRFSIYFNEMGLTNVKYQKRGTIDVYNYGESGLKVVVEYSDFPSTNKKSNIYFAFNNPKLQMITSGAWEIAVYPRLTPEMKYKPKDVKYTYYIVFDNETLECEIIKLEHQWFTFIHRKTTPIKEDNKRLVYCLESSPKPNYRTKITRAFTPIEEKIIEFFRKDKVFYQNNEIGDLVRNYINCCKPSIR